MRHLFSVLFILMIGSPAFSQKIAVNVYMQNKQASKKSDTIYYDFKRPLLWDDFKGVPHKSQFGGAVTASGFAFDSETAFDGITLTINIGVYTFFLKSKSWKKPEINSPYHLFHEQQHFDITRLGAENLMKEIRKANFTKANYEQLISSIFDKVYAENDEFQKKYDLETKNSLDVQKQEEWNQKMAGELSKIRR